MWSLAKKSGGSRGFFLLLCLCPHPAHRKKKKCVRNVGVVGVATGG
ncbi:hypothetical protein BACUNI_03178 [Bacteroides uniformis ATCC 8492]|uniref:Uncharacterized protein n=1 Tax=Bacteroides uniformis (strain ATCC 8492 / DSM 6597 / CCUG 4942 / CIP 103695 / JCM 5828 / KCTC 5204 / NCTC 13054 / VPI 0061) TaxID=411479 RepID=A0ABC9N8R8_BACUC|nr:hypothetical protein BACUNI_03178 [Bacteroides uniformis ATCC 8492]